MSVKRVRTGQARSKAADADPVRGQEVKLLDSLIPGLYAAATGQPLKPGDPVPKIDPAMVDRLLKVLELRLKYRPVERARAAGSRGRAPLPWAPAQNGADDA